MVVTRDVTVVGAGYSGLAAARRLRELGASVVVLEARDRVGGRVHTDHDTGTPIDLGGMWVGPTQDRILDLAARYGVETYPTPTAGDTMWVDRGRTRRFHSLLPPIGVVGRAVLAATLLRLDRMARSIDPGSPWSAAGARRLDEQTAATWLRRNVPAREARELVSAALATVMAADADEYSMLGLLTYIRSGGDVDALLAVEGGAQQDLFVPGADAVARRMAAELGDDVHLASPVDAITAEDGGVTVTGPAVEVRAGRVVVALPPPLTGRLRYEPALPASRDQLVQRTPMGSVHKAYLIYREPFWRAAGLNGEVLASQGLVTTAFDVTKPAGPPTLCTLVTGRRAREFGALPAPERRQVVTDAFATFFGPEARLADHFVEKSWIDEEWSRGGYAALMAPGALTAFGPSLRAPVGPIHWAGTETAERWMGYIDGAIRAGERAGEEAAAALAVSSDG